MHATIIWILIMKDRRASLRKRFHHLIWNNVYRKGCLCLVMTICLGKVLIVFTHKHQSLMSTIKRLVHAVGTDYLLKGSLPRFASFRLRLKSFQKHLSLTQLGLVLTELSERTVSILVSSFEKHLSHPTSTSMTEQSTNRKQETLE